MKNLILLLEMIEAAQDLMLQKEQKASSLKALKRACKWISV